MGSGGGGESELSVAGDEGFEAASAESSSHTARVETFVQTSASCLDGHVAPVGSNVQLPGRGRRTILPWIDDH
jgi:hypothetical protein